jgi:hypothetical protein
MQEKMLRKFDDALQRLTLPLKSIKIQKYHITSLLFERRLLKLKSRIMYVNFSLLFQGRNYGTI